MLRQGSFWLRIQGIQLGYGGSCSGQADQARRPPQERVANDRGEEILFLVQKEANPHLLGRNRPVKEPQCEFWKFPSFGFADR